MYFVYSLNLETLAVTLYSNSHTLDVSKIELHNTAVNFIRLESGEKKAQDAFRDGTPDNKISEDGYFLRHSDTKNNQIDVFQRKTIIVPGNLWGVTVTSSIKKVITFSITEASMGLQIEKGTITVSSKKPVTSSSKQAFNYDNMIVELKNTLSERKLNGVNSKRKLKAISENETLQKDKPCLLELIEEIRELYYRPLSPVESPPLNCTERNNEYVSSENDSGSELDFSKSESEYEYEYEYEYIATDTDEQN